MTASASAKSATNKPVTDVPGRPGLSTGDQTCIELPEEIQERDTYCPEGPLIGDIYFDVDQYALKPEAHERLSKNADFLKKNPKYTIEIQGHSDERGTNDYNLALADRRANVTREYMITLGIAATRLKTVSFGEERPVCTDHHESCWWRNRRGEFRLAGPS